MNVDRGGGFPASGPELPPWSHQGDRTMGCSAVRELVEQSLLDPLPAGLPPPATAHARTCPVCRSVIADLSRMDQALDGALRSARERMPAPSPERIDSILRGVSGPPLTAVLLGRIRRTVRRMLWLTLLALSFLPLAALGWWVLKLLGGN